MSGGLVIVARDKFGNIKKDIEITRDPEKGKIIKEDKLKEKEKEDAKRRINTGNIK